MNSLWLLKCDGVVHGNTHVCCARVQTASTEWCIFQIIKFAVAKYANRYRTHTRTEHSARRWLVVCSLHVCISCTEINTFLMLMFIRINSSHLLAATFTTRSRRFSFCSAGMVCALCARAFHLLLPTLASRITFRRLRVRAILANMCAGRTNAGNVIYFVNGKHSLARRRSHLYRRSETYACASHSIRNIQFELYP